MKRRLNFAHNALNRSKKRFPIAIAALSVASVSAGLSAEAKYETARVVEPGELELTVGKPGQGVFINLTPVNAEAAGFGRLDGDGPQGSMTSAVNYQPGGLIDPNVAIAAVRPDGTVSYENYHSPVDIIADAMIAVNGYTPAKERIIDTRDEGEPMKAGERRCFAVPGDAGDGAVLNTTVTGASTAGFITLTPSNSLAPNTSTNNFFGTPGEVVANAAVIEIGSNQYGEVCAINSHHGTAHLIIDSNGSIDKSVFTPTPTGKPIRLVDTREGLGGDRVHPGEEVLIKYGKPGDVVILNITPVNADGLGYGVAYGSHQQRPTISNVNFAPGSIIPNMAFAEVGPDGYVIYGNSLRSTTDVVIDVTGSFKGDQVDSLSLRVADTRETTKLEPAQPVRTNFREIPYDPNNRLDMNADMNLTKTHADILYGPTPSYAFDVYEGDTKPNGYTIVYFHGGGWESGTKSLNTGNEQLVRQLGANFGYKVISAAYPLSGEAPYPAQYEAADALIRYLKAHAKELGIDPNKLIVMGQSAGGDIATKAGLAKGEFVADWLPTTLQQIDTQVAAIVAVSAPYDFQRWVNDKALDSELSPVRGLDKLIGLGKCACYSMLNSPQYADRRDPALISLISSNDPIIPITGQKNALLRIAENGPIVYLLQSPVDAHNAALGFSAKTIDELIRKAA